MNNENTNLAADSPAALKYLDTIQATIQRMAGNSAQCKTWCIGLTSAVIILAARSSAPNHTWIGIVPIIMFCFLDSFYLSLERVFVDIYKDVSNKIRSNKLRVEDLFIFPAPRKETFRAKAKRIGSAFMSTSIYPFYILLLLTLSFVRVAVLTNS